MKYLEVVSDEVGAAIIPITVPTRNPVISIEFPGVGQRAREVISRSNTKATGKYPSWKMKRNMHYESLHECRAFKLFDACSDVPYYQEQPCRIRYVMNGEQRTHYPDALVKIPAGKQLVEIKTSEEAATCEVRERTAFMQRALPPLGYEYRVLTSDQLSKSPRLENVETMLRFGRSPVPQVTREQIRQIFKVNGPMPWGAFPARTSTSNYRAVLCRLVLEGAVKIDFNQPLRDESLIYWVDNSNGGASWE